MKHWAGAFESSGTIISGITVGNYSNIIIIITVDIIDY